MSARENAFDATSNEILDRFGCVARHVEGTMTGHAQGARRLGQFRHPPHVDPALGRQAAENDARHAERPQRRDILEHAAILEVGIEEVAASRSHHHEERDAGDVQCDPHRADARRDPAFEQTGAEFDPVGPTVLGRNEPVDPLDADFDDLSCGHGSGLVRQSDGLTVTHRSKPQAMLHDGA